MSVVRNSRRRGRQPCSGLRPPSAAFTWASRLAHQLRAMAIDRALAGRTSFQTANAAPGSAAGGEPGHDHCRRLVPGRVGRPVGSVGVRARRKGAGARELQKLNEPKSVVWNQSVRPFSSRLKAEAKRLARLRGTSLRSRLTTPWVTRSVRAKIEWVMVIDSATFQREKAGMAKAGEGAFSRTERGRNTGRRQGRREAEGVL